MGWTSCYRANHWKIDRHGKRVVDRKKCVDELYTAQRKDENGKVVSFTRVIKSYMRGNVWYDACETVEDNKATVWAGICLTSGRSAYDGTLWGYKDMGESSEPFYYDCPEGVLKLLTEPRNQESANWRQHCREWKEAQKRRKKMEKKELLPNGIRVYYKGGWVVTSQEYVRMYRYTGVRYGRGICKSESIARFIEKYGTAEQKAEWAKTHKSA